MNEKIDKLIKLSLINKNSEDFPYLKISDQDKYNGWVSDFNLTRLSDSSKIMLDLRKEKDLFLLFVLASSWSKNTRWENAVYFVVSLILMDNFNIKNWCSQEFVNEQIEYRQISCQNALNKVCGFKSRIKTAFKKDFYPSVEVLSDNWQIIKMKLEESDKKQNWNIFIDYISSIEGLGTGKNKMRIKIPLILRELRCQNIYNIDGKYCCVVDKRVRDTYKDYIGKKLPSDYLKASEVIWNDFKELYDIPAFAYADFLEKKLI